MRGREGRAWEDEEAGAEAGRWREILGRQGGGIRRRSRKGITHIHTYFEGYYIPGTWYFFSCACMEDYCEGTEAVKRPARMGGKDERGLKGSLF